MSKKYPFDGGSNKDSHNRNLRDRHFVEPTIGIFKGSSNSKESKSSSIGERNSNSSSKNFKSDYKPHLVPEGTGKVVAGVGIGILVLGLLKWVFGDIETNNSNNSNDTEKPILELKDYLKIIPRKPLKIYPKCFNEYKDYTRYEEIVYEEYF